jgi:hypothetical protein
MTLKSTENVQMYTLNERPFGYSWEEWTVRWWEWFLSIPKEIHPAYDETGEKYAVGQTDPNTIFLAGTTGGTAKRSINILAGKAVLFPVINFSISYTENPNLKTDEELTSFARSQVDDIVKKEGNIDGVDLTISENNRVYSPPFDFSFPVNNVFGLKAGPTRGAGDGYWIFLKPLSPGKHTLRTFGCCMLGRIQIGVNIDLTARENL